MAPRDASASKKAEVELTQVTRQKIEEEKIATEAAKRRAVEEEKAEKAAKARRERLMRRRHLSHLCRMQ